MVFGIGIRWAVHMRLTRFVARMATVCAVFRDDMPRYCEGVGSHEQSGEHYVKFASH